MFICVICHFTQFMWLIELVYKIKIFITVSASKIKINVLLYLFTTSYLYQACIQRMSMPCQFVVLVVCASIQNTIHLSIVLVLIIRVSKPIKFSLHFTNNIVICSRAGKTHNSWSKKEEHRSSFHLSRGVFSDSSYF